MEEQLIRDIRNKNEHALRQVYKTHYPMILNMVVTNNGTEPEAKDVYQEAIIAFYERLQQADFLLTCKIKTYLYAVCRRIWLKRLYEKRKAPVRLDEAETFSNIDDEMNHIEESDQQFEQMKKSLSALGEPCATIIQDFYVANLSMDEIRDKFGYTNSDNAKNQKYKCMQRLKKLFFKEI